MVFFGKENLFEFATRLHKLAAVSAISLILLFSAVANFPVSGHNNANTIQRAQAQQQGEGDAEDTTPPELTVPESPLIVQANDSSGATVDYQDQVSATDEIDGEISTVDCDPPSGSAFQLGNTTVTCTAEDSAGNKGEANFTVSVSPPSDTSNNNDNNGFNAETVNNETNTSPAGNGTLQTFSKNLNDNIQSMNPVGRSDTAGSSIKKALCLSIDDLASSLGVNFTGRALPDKPVFTTQPGSYAGFTLHPDTGPKLGDVLGNNINSNPGSSNPNNDEGLTINPNLANKGIQGLELQTRGHIKQFLNGDIFQLGDEGCAQWISWEIGVLKKYWDVGGPDGSMLGYPTLGEASGIINNYVKPNEKTSIVDFENGTIYSSPTTGVHVIYNPDIAKKSKEKLSILGFPTSDETTGDRFFTNTVTDSFGKYPNKFYLSKYVTFEHGAIFWSKYEGAHEIHGDIYDKYISHENYIHTSAPFGVFLASGIDDNGLTQIQTIANGELGYPVTDEFNTTDAVGRGNKFVDGAIFWSPSNGAHEIDGGFYLKWATLNYEKGIMGYPTEDTDWGSADTISSTEHAQEFQHNVLAGQVNFANGFAGLTTTHTSGGLRPGDPYDTSLYDKLHVMSAQIYKKWHDASGSQGCFGYPTTDEQNVPSPGSHGWRYINFEYGHMGYDPANGPDSDPYAACTFAFRIDQVTAHVKAAGAAVNLFGNTNYDHDYATLEAGSNGFAIEVVPKVKHAFDLGLFDNDDTRGNNPNVSNTFPSVPQIPAHGDSSVDAVVAKDFEMGIDIESHENGINLDDLNTAIQGIQYVGQAVPELEPVAKAAEIFGKVTDYLNSGKSGCDGPVAKNVITVSYDQLVQWMRDGNGVHSDTFRDNSHVTPGGPSTSGLGCGRNPDYEVQWTLQRVAPPDILYVWPKQ